MKRLSLGLLLISMLVLSACDVVITGEPGPGSDIRIYNAKYSTNFDGNIICDNRTTYLTYEFSYDGILTRWSSYLKGLNSGDVFGYDTFYPSDSRVINFNDNYVRVTYAIPPYTAPLSVPASDTLNTQGIVVSDGLSRLYVKLNGLSRDYNLSSKDIPIIQCN